MIIDLSSIILFITFLCNLTVGVYVLKNSINRKLNIIFSLVCFQIALWNLVNLISFITSDTKLIILFSQLTLWSVLFIPSTYLFFTTIFIGERPSRNKILSWYIPSAMMLPFIFTSLNVKGFDGVPTGYNFIPGKLYLVYTIYFIVFIGISIIKLVKFYRTNSSSISRHQTQYLLLGISVGSVIAIVTNAILPLLWSAKLNVYGTPVSIIFAVTSAYAITRYRLFDIKFIARKWLLEVIAILSALALAFVVAYIFTLVLNWTNQFIFTAIFIASYVIFERFLRYRIVKKNHEIGLDLSIPDPLTFSKDVDQTLQHLHAKLQQQLQTHFQITNNILCVLDLNAKYYQSVFTDTIVRFQQNHPLARLAKQSAVIAKEELESNAYPVSNDEKKEILSFMKKHHLVYVIALTYSDEVYGFIFIPQEQIGDTSLYSKNQLAELAYIGSEYGQSFRDIVVYESVMNRNNMVTT